MLEFFRKYQKFCFFFIAVVIIASFSFVFSTCDAHEVSHQTPFYIEKKVAVISSGLPGVGKSTLLKELSKRISNSIYLDKDTVAPALLTGQKDSSYFSDYYYKYVRNQTYEAMFAIAEDNCKNGYHVVLIDGFLGDKLSSHLVQNFLQSPYSEKRVVYFYCSQEVNKERIIVRGEIRDRQKLIDFSEYYRKTLAIHEKELEGFSYLSINTEDDQEK